MVISLVRTCSRGHSTYITLYASLVHNLVDFVGCHAWLRSSCGNVENLSCQSTHLPHPILLFLG
jgi:hypothetical protein